VGDDACGEPTGASATLALGALAATETLRVLVSPPACGRVTTLSLDGAVARATDVAATPGCAICGGSA
jgi:hypothetical protein